MMTSKEAVKASRETRKRGRKGRGGRSGFHSSSTIKGVWEAFTKYRRERELQDLSSTWF
jgi:hypothetical protein